MAEKTGIAELWEFIVGGGMLVTLLGFAGWVGSLKSRVRQNEKDADVLADKIKEVFAEVKELRKELGHHTTDETGRLATIEADVKHIIEAIK